MKLLLYIKNLLKGLFGNKKLNDKQKLSENDIAFNMFYGNLHQFYKNPCDETVYKAYDGILACMVAECKALVPCESDSNISYDLYNMGSGWSYIICTNPQELSKCEGKASVFQSYISIFERAANDDEINGIVFDPYNSSGATLYCSRIVCRKLADAYHQMKDNL